jgi:hypothetical protein
MKNMKTKSLNIVAFAFLAFILAGCVGELPEEQFEKYVLLTRNGWVEQDIEFTTSSKVDLPVVVSVSGTSVNKENVEVKLKYDTDLLARYNLEKYKLQEGLYYVPVPQEAITLNSAVTIPSGSENAMVGLTIDFDKIADPYKDYVIPVSIETVSKYSLQPLDQGAILRRSEVLYHVRRMNSFSGDYTGSSTVFQTSGRGTAQSPYTKKGTGSPVLVKTLYALSEDECYFFAGQFDRNNVLAKDFIVKVKMNEDESLAFSSPNPALQLNVDTVIIKDGTRSRITTSREPVSTDQRKEQVTKTFKFVYTFYDLTDKSDSTASNNHILYVEGNMTRTRTEMKK